ncbi:MAG: NAD(P)H-binding protein [Candidatus Brocadiae bacterium]|nr:NAD(P)H-binding protein [Candidatus Brocadiia bacterium]
MPTLTEFRARLLESPAPFRRIAVAGSSGYVGARLVDRLVAGGRTVHSLARSARPSKPGVLDFGADVQDPASLRPALQDADAAVYLVHAMAEDGDFAEKEAQGARNFAQACADAGVRRIVFLGALRIDSDDLSPHLASRHRTGDALRSAGVPVTELRASIVLGAGSLPFRILASLVERLPVMICPKWVSTPCQPIGIDDVLEYLFLAATRPWGGGGVYEVGGERATTYGDLMREYARQRGLRRLMVPVPVLTPRLSSMWLRLVTPATAQIGRHLVEGLRNATVVRDRRALQEFAVRPIDFPEAMARAISGEGK